LFSGEALRSRSMLEPVLPVAPRIAYADIDSRFGCMWSVHVNQSFEDLDRCESWAS
jgi:hypothetical protein